MSECKIPCRDSAEGGAVAAPALGWRMHGAETGVPRRATLAMSHSSKYEHAIELKRTRARKPWTCYSCGDPIDPGENYYRQSLGMIKKPPRIYMSAFCVNCKDSPLARQLNTKP